MPCGGGTCGPTTGGGASLRACTEEDPPNASTTSALVILFCTTFCSRVFFMLAILSHLPFLDCVSERGYPTRVSHGLVHRSLRLRLSSGKGEESRAPVYGAV